jgi:hypothetical protein
VLKLHQWDAARAQALIGFPKNPYLLNPKERYADVTHMLILHHNWGAKWILGRVTCNYNVCHQEKLPDTLPIHGLGLHFGIRASGKGQKESQELFDFVPTLINRQGFSSLPTTKIKWSMLCR